MRYWTAEQRIGRFLVVSMRVEGSRTNDEVLAVCEVYGTSMASAKAQGLQHVAIIDISAASVVDAQQRRLLGDWFQSMVPLQLAVQARVAYVVETAEQRGSVLAVHWLAEPNADAVSVDTVDQALTWAFKVCERNGEKLDDGMRSDYRRKLTWPSVRSA